MLGCGVEVGMVAVLGLGHSLLQVGAVIGVRMSKIDSVLWCIHLVKLPRNAVRVLYSRCTVSCCDSTCPRGGAECSSWRP